jgi:2-polyprenyl-3-methyl-5-hydroxy-6-metoxy-1,4-benzoquinol methylase
VPEAAERLDVEEAIDFWDGRHRMRGELLSGGDVSFDHETNEIFYALRLGRLIDIVGDQGFATAPLRVLDAGCGKGFFARAMATFGHDVDGIDTSAFAIDECERRRVGRERYAVSSLDAWHPPRLYDVVLAVDVLFHIMDDGVWERSVRNLASLARLGGLLVLADHVTDEDRVWGKYQVTRAAHRYHDLALPLGFRADPFVPYRFRDSPAGFHVFTRVN